MEAQSGLGEPQSPHSLLSGFSHRRITTWPLDSALLMVEDRLSNQLDRSFDESTDMLQKLWGIKGEGILMGRQTTIQTYEQSLGKYLKVLNGVMRVNECLPVDFTVATFRGTEKEATPSWKPSLLG